jgi:hypothetical protein
MVRNDRKSTVAHGDNKQLVRETVELEVQPNGGTALAARGLNDAPVWKCLLERQWFNRLTVQQLTAHWVTWTPARCSDTGRTFCGEVNG